MNPKGNGRAVSGRFFEKEKRLRGGREGKHGGGDQTKKKK